MADDAGAWSRRHAAHWGPILGQNSYMRTPDPCTRPVQPADVAAVVGMVHELAQYERAGGECRLTEAQLEAALFTSRPALFGHVATIGGQVVGCALWFLNFSTWRGTHGIYLEDLYVQPAHRGKGLGKALLRELARECDRRGYERLEWAVLDWNEPAINFYVSLAAEAQDEWTVFRLANGPLAALAHL
jgi:GNAT superfamily N-acetyltransferase